MSVRRLPVHTDERGRLLVAEGADIGFPVRRVFVVTDAPAGVERGRHEVACRQVLVLVAGGATVWTSPDAEALPEEHRLDQPGDAVDLPAGVWVRYALSGPAATVLVLAEQAFDPDRGRAR